MGFSVSASTAIVFIAAFVSVGILYSAAYNGFEQVNDATAIKQEAGLEQQNTAINITEVTHDTTSTTDYVNVTVANVGTTALSVHDTDVLLNGTYQSTYVNRTVTTDSGTVAAGGDGTDLWLPGEELTVSIHRNMSEPIHVKVVTGPGVADAEVYP
ncbi:MAG: fla cluster protein FlaF [Halanaeroarchaeum sp.]